MLPNAAIAEFLNVRCASWQQNCVNALVYAWATAGDRLGPVGIVVVLYFLFVILTLVT
jgi:hypothetical protein